MVLVVPVTMISRKGPLLISCLCEDPLLEVLMSSPWFLKVPCPSLGLKVLCPSLCPPRSPFWGQVVALVAQVQFT